MGNETDLAYLDVIQAMVQVADGQHASDVDIDWQGLIKSMSEKRKKPVEIKVDHFEGMEDLFTV